MEWINLYDEVEMVSIAFKNLFHEKTRFIISVGGVAFAILLILILKAGVPQRIFVWDIE